MYAYDKLARSVAEARSVLPENVTLDFTLVVGDRPEKKAEDLVAIDNAFHAAGTPVTIVDMDDLPDTDEHWTWNSRRVICFKENYLADLAYRKYTDFLSWEVDCTVQAADFQRRLPLWLDHASHGHVMCAMMPYNYELVAAGGKPKQPAGESTPTATPEPVKQKFIAYLFLPQQLQAEEPIQIASFVTREKMTKHGIKSSSKRFKFDKKNDVDDLVLCEIRKQCITWMNEKCQGSNHDCKDYAPPPEYDVYQEAVWAVANPKLKPGRDGTHTDDYTPTMLQTIPIEDIFKQPRTPEGLYRAHGGHLGFTLIPAFLFRRLRFRYKPWVNQHPDTWFFFDCAKKNIPMFLDMELVAAHDHREWSSEVSW